MTPDLPAVEVAIVDKTNAFRKAHKLGALRRNAKLDSAARAFAKFMARTSEFSHTADGRKPAERITAAGYSYCLVAENLAFHADSRGFASGQLAQASLTGWQKSPGHRKNMMQRHITEIGVGVAKAANAHEYYSVQLFGRPKALTFQFRITNKSRSKTAYTLDGRRFTLKGRTVMTHSVCIPQRLTFRNVRVRGRAAPSTLEFPVKADDEFFVEPVTGGLRVEHRPRLK